MVVRPDGTWQRLTSIKPGKKLCQGGAFQKASPPNRLTFTFAWGEEGKPGLETLVTLAFGEQDGEDSDLPSRALPAGQEMQGPPWRLDEGIPPAGRMLRGL
jgi:uncharacterized protein YndB with AHSA1/START domain